MDIQLLNALGVTDCAIFTPIDTNHYACLTPEVEWSAHILPETKANEPFSSFRSLFLNDFLFDAQEIWHDDTAMTLSSGYWSEQIDDHTLRLEALAINNGEGQHFLVVKNVAAQFAEKQKTLQAARELLLSHHEIVGQHEYIRHRLDEALLNNQKFDTLLPPLKQTIHHLDTGVVILDKHQHTIIDNRAAKKLLLCNEGNNSGSMLQQFMRDVSIPDGFLPSLVDKKAPWQGELYWQADEAHEAWLQLTIHPVLNDNTLTHWIFLFTDITHIHNKEDAVLPATGLDSLTRVANRNYYNTYTRKLVKQGAPFTLITIDIRAFKKINEKLGYHSGDEILRHFAQRLQNFVGHNGFVARIGSNEFAVVKQFDAPSRQQIEHYASTMLALLVKTYTSLQGAESNLSVNMGIANFPEHATQADELLHHSDIALQIAKYQGKNTTLIYDEDLKRQQQAMSTMEAQLRDAIANQQLELFLQPIVDLHSGQVVKCEALTRWRLDDGSFIPPDVFIPLAERTDLILPFGEWLIQEACRTLESLSCANIDIRLAINISGRQVVDAALLAQIQTALKQFNVGADNLSIELTESVLIDSLDTVSVLLNELRALGITISIDDFGTGFSSLVYLKRLPIDELKIDRSFVRDLSENTDDQAIIQAILSLAKSLNLQIIAEGIETQRQQDFLVSHECTYGQGYFYDKPLTVSEFIAKRLAPKKAD